MIEQKWYNNTTATTTDDFKFGYDRDSNRLYRTNEVNHNFDELCHANGSSNGYDNLNQLTSFARGTLNAGHDTISSPTHSINYSLDAVGNFASTTTDGGSPVNRTHNKQNKVTGVGASTLTFDNNGNLTKDDAGQQYVYDAWNRLVAVKNSGGTTITTYKYDGLSRRIVEAPTGSTRDLYYSAAWQVLEERLNGVTTATIQYVWSPVYIDALVLRDRSTLNIGTLDERLWVQQDANYNVTALVNGSGTVVERYVYDPYGKQTVLDASFNSRTSSSYAFIIGFQGARLDTTSGLYNERFRDLHPGLGRWIQTDPLGFGGGDTNLYRADGDAPTQTSDPFGLSGGFDAYGHHWIPIGTQKIFWRYLSPEARIYGAGACTGPLGGDHNIVDGILHSEYTWEVSKNFRQFLKMKGAMKDGKFVRQLSGEEMEEFNDLIKNGKNADGSVNHTIRRFNKWIERMARKANGGRLPPQFRWGFAECAKNGERLIKNPNFLARYLGIMLLMGAYQFPSPIEGLEDTSASPHLQAALRHLKNGNLMAAEESLFGPGGVAAPDGGLYLDLWVNVNPNTAILFLEMYKKIKGIAGELGQAGKK